MAQARPGLGLHPAAHPRASGAGGAGGLAQGGPAHYCASRGGSAGRLAEGGPPRLAEAGGVPWAHAEHRQARPRRAAGTRASASGLIDARRHQQSAVHEPHAAGAQWLGAPHSGQSRFATGSTDDDA